MTTGRKFIVFDTETTGLFRQGLDTLNTPAAITAKGSEVCQIGGLVLDETMSPLKLFCHYCDTVVANSSQAALEVHGIDMRNCRQYVTGQFLPEVMQRFLPEFFEPNVIFIGYNVEFDMAMVAQTLANSPFSFNWSPVRASVVPRRGRHSVDVAEFFKVGSNYRRLVSFEKELLTPRMQFLSYYSNFMTVETNCLEMLEPTWDRAHNSFFDALNTYLLWGDKIWKKKLV